MDDGDNNPWTWLEYRTNPLARIFLAVTLPLMLIAFGTLLIRTVPRLRAATRLSVDDWFAIAGFVLFLAYWIVVLVPISHHLDFDDRQIQTIGQLEWSVKLFTISSCLWACGIACVKISVACMLLRFRNTLLWRGFLYIMIGIQILFAVGLTLWMMLHCRPLSTSWDYTTDQLYCDTSNSVKAVNYIAIAINIASEVAFALLPLTFVLQLQRPLQERLLICGLMGVGLIIVAISAIRVVVFLTVTKGFVVVMDWFVSCMICNCTEAFLASIVASLPFTKAPLQAFLSRLGFGDKVNRLLGHTEPGRTAEEGFGSQMRDLSQSVKKPSKGSSYLCSSYLGSSRGSDIA